MIQKLGIRNFKTWGEAAIAMAPLTGFFGPNSSGKTSILQLILLLKQTIESSDRAQVLDFGDKNSKVELGTFRDVIFSHSTQNPLFFQLIWHLPKPAKIFDPLHGKAIQLEDNKIAFQCEICQTAKEQVYVNWFSYQFAGHEFKLERKPSNGSSYDLSVNSPDEGKKGFQLLRAKGRAWPLPVPVKFYGFPDQVKAYFQNAGFLSDFQLYFENLFEKIFYLGPLREYPERQYIWAGSLPSDMGQRGEKVVEALLGSRQRGEKISRGKGKDRLLLEEYVALWLKKLNLIHDFEVKRISEESNLYKVQVRKTAKSPFVLITEVGFGVSQILPVITLCFYAPPGSVLIIEQPEIHLHPSVQAGLADVFIDAIQKRGVQIILESHSEHLLRRLQRRIAEEEFSSSDAALYFCQNTGGASSLTPLKMNLFGNISNWPEGFFGDDFAESFAMMEAIHKRKKEKSS